MSLKTEVRRLSDLFEFYLIEAYGYKKPEVDLENAQFKAKEWGKLIDNWTKPDRKIKISGKSPYVCGKCGIRMYYSSSFSNSPESKDIQCVNTCCDDYRKSYRPPTMSACDD